MKIFPPTGKLPLCAIVIAALGAAATLSVGYTSSAPVPSDAKKINSDYTMFGGTVSRNMVNLIDKNVPDKINPNGPEVLWKANLGSHAYGGPIISNGKVLVGTNNDSIEPRNIRDFEKNKEGKLEPTDRGVLLCLDEKSGKFLWQSVHTKLPSGQVSDWPKEGICSTPAVDGERVYYVSNRCTVVCVDINGRAGKTAGGIERKGFNDPTDARFIWEYDMMKELKVFPHDISACSPLIVGDIIFVVTANGVDEGHLNIPSPEAPSFIALGKKDGKLLWRSNAPGKDIMHGQWSNPVYADIGGVRQAIFPGGDGWLYSFVPETGELIWKFDCNPKEVLHQLGGLGTCNDFLGTPVVYDNKVYIGTGQDPEHSVSAANFYCIAPTRKGDISRTIISGRDKDGKPLNEKPNPNSCEVWRYGGTEKRKWAQRDFTFGRTLSTACVVDDIVYIAELAGYLHCINAGTGEHYWQYDTKSSIWGSPYYVDGKILLANEMGEVLIFKHEKEQKVYDEVKAAQNAKDKKEARQLMREVRKQVSDKYLISKAGFDNSIRTTPVVANGVLYVMTETTLYAIKAEK
jgi:outer membrane protein assembly factor BamB